MVKALIGIVAKTLMGTKSISDTGTLIIFMIFLFYSKSDAVQTVEINPVVAKPFIDTLGGTIAGVTLGSLTETN
jgi:hypothetical protein